MMPEKSIILRDWQALAAAEGRLKQISVPLKPQPEYGHTVEWHRGINGAWCAHDSRYRCEYGAIGEWYCPYRVGTVLVGKETWHYDWEHDRVFYKADADTDGRSVPYLMNGAGGYGGGVALAKIDRWNVPQRMPRKHARHRWTVTAVSVRRVGEITAEEVYQHGIDIEQEPHSTIFDRAEHAAIGGLCIECDAEVWPFRHIWERRYGNRYPWPDAWVWVHKLKPEKCDVR